MDRPRRRERAGLLGLGQRGVDVRPRIAIAVELDVALAEQDLRLAQRRPGVVGIDPLQSSCARGDVVAEILRKT